MEEIYSKHFSEYPPIFQQCLKTFEEGDRLSLTEVCTRIAEQRKKEKDEGDPNPNTVYEVVKALRLDGFVTVVKKPEDATEIQSYIFCLTQEGSRLIAGNKLSKVLHLSPVRQPPVRSAVPAFDR